MRPTAKFWALRMLAGVLLLIGAIPARAYVLENVAWSLGTATSPTVITMQLELQTGGPANKTLMDGKTNWDQVALEAFSIWNQYLVGMQFNGVAGSTAAVSTSSNGINTVSWRASEFDEAWPTGVVGLTYYYALVTSATIRPTQETDVIFNSNITWDSYRGAQIPGPIDLRRVALHEFGHALGLNHPNDAGQVVTAIMNSTVNGIDTLQPDDIAGGQYLYNPIPLITTQPSSQTAPPGGTATFTVATTDDPAATFQWKFFNGNAISGATNASLTLSNLSASDQGNYQVVVTNRAGHVNSSVATLVVAAGPLITSNPASQTLATGAPLALSVSTSPSSGVTYQWYLNGTAIAGATGSTYSLANAGATDAGSYTVVVSNGVATSTSSAATVAVNTTARLINLSTIANTGSAGLTEGFIVGGSGTKNLLIRGIGPALTAFSVPNPLSNPILTLNATSTTPAVTNAGWGGSQVLADAFAAVGAFSLPAGSADSALLTSLQVSPSAPTSETATLIGAGGAQGNALLEVYDRDALSATARLINLSVIDYIAPPSTLSAGFVISGTSSMTLLIRGVGPALAAIGVPTVLAQPQLDVHSGSSIVATNTGWDGTAKTSAVFAQVGAFALTPGSADSAVVITLPPGNYSAVVSGANSTSGNALVEIYEVR